MAPGTHIAYRLRLHGIPISRESEITARDPPHFFADEQRAALIVIGTTNIAPPPA